MNNSSIFTFIFFLWLGACALRILNNRKSSSNPNFTIEAKCEKSLWKISHRLEVQLLSRSFLIFTILWLDVYVHFGQNNRRQSKILLFLFWILVHVDHNAYTIELHYEHLHFTLLHKHYVLGLRDQYCTIVLIGQRRRVLVTNKRVILIGLCIVKFLLLCLSKSIPNNIYTQFQFESNQMCLDLPTEKTLKEIKRILMKLKVKVFS